MLAGAPGSVERASEPAGWLKLRVRKTAKSTGCSAACCSCTSCSWSAPGLVCTVGLAGIQAPKLILSSYTHSQDGHLCCCTEQSGNCYEKVKGRRGNSLASVHVALA